MNPLGSKWSRLWAGPKSMRGRELERVFFLFGVGTVGMQGRVFLIVVVVLKEAKKR